jgi:hypothetical protein
LKGASGDPLDFQLQSAPPENNKAKIADSIHLAFFWYCPRHFLWLLQPVFRNKEAKKIKNGQMMAT